MAFHLDNVENIVRKGDNAGDQYFSSILTFLQGLFDLVIQIQDRVVNSLPNDKILNCFKLKAFADDKSE